MIPTANQPELRRYTPVFNKRINQAICLQTYATVKKKEKSGKQYGITALGVPGSTKP